jgi:hypothetical protein
LDFFNVLQGRPGDVEAEIKNRGSTDLCIVVGRTPTGITGVRESLRMSEFQNLLGRRVIVGGQ